jgi:hypothetical protein
MTTTNNDRDQFEAWIKTRIGYPFAGTFTNLMWDAWQGARKAAPVAPTLPEWFAYDDTNDTMTIHGIKYSGELMRDFARHMPNDQRFMLKSRADGVLTVTKLDDSAEACAHCKRLPGDPEGMCDWIECGVGYPAATTASASGWEGLPPIGERESIMDVCGLPKLMRDIIETKGSVDSLSKLYDFIDVWGDARFEFGRAPAPSQEAQAAHAGADTERLDWLQRECFDILYPGAAYASWQARGGRMGLGSDGNCTFREAIDKARAAIATSEQKGPQA